MVTSDGEPEPENLFLEEAGKPFLEEAGVDCREPVKKGTCSPTLMLTLEKSLILHPFLKYQVEGFNRKENQSRQPQI